MDRWDWLIIGAAGYLAITILVRLMAGRRNRMIQIVRDQFDSYLKSGDNNTDDKKPDSTRDAA